jgi:outer membrane lipoprotein-sorting protein
MRKILSSLLILLCLLPMPAMAKKTAVKDNVVVDPTLLSGKDQKDIGRIETYLNELKSPGKMRVVYDPPNKDFIIADGSTVHIWNDDMQQQTNVDQGSSLAEFILRDPVKLSGEITVTKFERFPAKMEITLVQTGDPASGALTLIFEDNPLKLRQWRVLDPQGRTTGVNLENEQRDVSFKSNLFTFVPPNFGKNRNSQIPE